MSKTKLSEIKIGDFCTVERQGFMDYGIAEVIDKDYSHFLIEYDSNGKNNGYIQLDMEEDLLRNYPDVQIKEGKDYEGIHSDYLKLAYRAVRDTKLARKMYTEIHKEEEGYIWVK